MNGILSKGLSNAMEQILAYVTNANVQFNSSSDRSEEFLLNYINAPEMQNFSDLIFYYMINSFDKTLLYVRDSAIKYFDKAK